MDIWSTLDSLNIDWRIIWKSRWKKSSMSADLASRLYPITPTEPLFNLISLHFSLNFSPADIIYKPIYLARLSEMDVPLNISEFLHYKKPLLILIPPNLPTLVYKSLWLCFSKFPIKGIMILPALIFTPWFQSGPSQFSHFFDVKINDDYFTGSVSLNNTFNFSMRVLHFKF